MNFYRCEIFFTKEKNKYEAHDKAVYLTDSKESAWYLWHFFHKENGFHVDIYDMYGNLMDASKGKSALNF
jgi:hypothetical protein